MFNDAGSSGQTCWDERATDAMKTAMTDAGKYVEYIVRFIFMNGKKVVEEF